MRIRIKGNIRRRRRDLVRMRVKGNIRRRRRRGRRKNENEGQG